MRDLVWRAKCLSLQDDPFVAELIAQMGEHTEALESLWEQQRQPGYEPKWWQDGEYDGARADQ